MDARDASCMTYAAPILFHFLMLPLLSCFFKLKIYKLSEYICFLFCMKYQVLFILGIEEDAQQHVLPLSEVTWRPHPNDPTLVYIEKIPPPLKPQNPDMEVSFYYI